MDQIIEQLLGYLRGMWRRRWYVVAVAWVLAIAGWAWVYQLPDEYRASARVYVDTQSLLAPLLGNMTVQPRIEQRLNVMTRTLLSRPNLEEVARRSDLDLRADSPEEMEAIVSELERNLSLSGSNRQNLYTISYDSRDPELARNVVQSLLAIFVESGIGSTRQDMNAPQDFIRKQVEAYEARLAELQDRITGFKQKHGSLVGNGSGDYYSRLEAARQQYEQARLQLQEARSRRDSYQARLSGTEPTLLEPAPSTSGVAELDRRISDLQQRLDQLRLQYTDKHPDVQATQRVIENLQQQRKEQLAAQRGRGLDFSGDSQVNSYLQQLRFALAEAESQVASLESRVSEYRAQYQQLKDQVSRIPAIQAEWNRLQDEYQRVKSNYDQLVASSTRAELSQEVVNTAQSVDFRIVDPPFVPSQPVGPDRVMLSSGVLVAALAVGLGVAFLLSQLRTTVDTRQALTALSGRPLLGSVSAVESPQRARRRRVGWVAWGGSAALLVAVYGGLVAFFLTG